MKESHWKRYLLCLLLLVGVAAFTVWPREPRYQGRKLSAWLELLAYNPQKIENAAETENRQVRAVARAALVSPDVEIKEGAIVRGPKDKKQIALVFTGHEYAEGGETILKELARHGAKASFFFTGDFLVNPAHQAIIGCVCEDGHYLGPHSDKHLLYCSWEQPEKTLVSREEFRADFSGNLMKLLDRQHAGEPVPPYFLPAYEHYNPDIVEWAAEYLCTTVNLTPGTRSAADYTGEADTNFVSSQQILDSIISREQQDPHGLNGYILLFHIGSGPGRTDKFHTRFGELLDYLARRGYRFVRIDEMIDPRELQACAQKPAAKSRRQGGLQNALRLRPIADVAKAGRG